MKEREGREKESEEKKENENWMRNIIIASKSHFAASSRPECSILFFVYVGGCRVGW